MKIQPHLLPSLLLGLSPLYACAQIPGPLTLSGTVEVEASSSETFAAGSVKASDIVLATVELGLDAKINEAVSAHILLLHEDDDTEPMEVDEAIISLRPANSPLALDAGRLYVPFGNFESNMISDPLTLEIGETREAAIQFGIGSGGLRAALYTFNGEIDEATTNASEDLQYGVALGFAQESEDGNLDIGVGYISALNDSDALQGVFDDGAGGYNPILEYVAGFSAHAILNHGPFGVIAEYIAAADNFAVSDLAHNGQGAEPSAYNLELAYSFDLAGLPTTIAIAQQETEEALDLGLPETRTLLGLSLEVYEATQLSIEFAKDEDYATTVSGNSGNGTGNNANHFTLQLAVEF